MESSDNEPAASAEGAVTTNPIPETSTELPRCDLKPEPKSKPDPKPEKSKTDTKTEKCKSELKLEKKETKVEKSKAEYKTDSGGEGSGMTPPTRRRASADATNVTPDRKKRRLTRPRKL